MMEGMNLTKIYCRNFYQCHSVYPVQQYDNKKLKEITAPKNKKLEIPLIENIYAQGQRK
jgi:hypothetical protein